MLTDQTSPRTLCAGVREATVADLPHLLDLGRRMHAESRYRDYPYSEPKLRGLWSHLIADEDGIVLLSPHGMLFGAVEEYWFSTVRYAAEFVLYVEPEHRKGFEAVRLIHAYEAAARALGAADVHLQNTTGVDVAMTERFFERMGYDRIGGNFVRTLTEGTV